MVLSRGQQPLTSYPCLGFCGASWDALLQLFHVFNPNTESLWGRGASSSLIFALWEVNDIMKCEPCLLQSYCYWILLGLAWKKVPFPVCNRPRHPSVFFLPLLFQGQALGNDYIRVSLLYPLCYHSEIRRIHLCQHWIRWAIAVTLAATKKHVVIRLTLKPLHWKIVALITCSEKVMIK